MEERVLTKLHICLWGCTWEWKILVLFWGRVNGGS